MKIRLLLFFVLLTGTLSAQNCLEEWRKVFEKQGAYSVGDDMHRKVYIAFVEDGDVYCVEGKVRVENGKITSVFLMFEDGTYELMDMKITNAAGKLAGITNGISEECINEEGDHFFVIFVEKLKPPKKKYKTVGGPGQ